MMKKAFYLKRSGLYLASLAFFGLAVFIFKYMHLVVHSDSSGMFGFLFRLATGRLLAALPFLFAGAILLLFASYYQADESLENDSCCPANHEEEENDPAERPS